MINFMYKFKHFRSVWVVEAVYVLQDTSARVWAASAFRLKAVITIAQHMNIGRRVLTTQACVNQIAATDHHFAQEL